MKKQSDVVIYRKAFFDLFNDLAWFASESKYGKTPENMYGDGRFSRAAILYGGLCIEAASNCCLNSVGLSKEAEKDLNFAKTLSKFDIFLVSSGCQQTLDRKSIIVKRIAELTESRNAFVHPKISESGFAYAGKGMRLENIENKRRHYLDIPIEQESWSSFDAHKVFVAVHDFMNYFFFHVLGLDRSQLEHRDVAAKILCSEIEHFTIKADYITPGRKKIISNPSNGLMDLSRKYDLDNAFLGYYTSDGNGVMIYPKRELGTPITWEPGS